MGFNSAFKGLKLFKNPGNGRLNNLNDPVLNVLTSCDVHLIFLSPADVHRIMRPFQTASGTSLTSTFLIYWVQMIPYLKIFLVVPLRFCNFSLLSAVMNRRVPRSAPHTVQLVKLLRRKAASSDADRVCTGTAYRPARFWNCCFRV